MPLTSVICFDDVSYKYPRSDKYALEGINISIMEGEFLAVMGENNAGKTTFCKLINGIIPHIYGGYLSGNIIIDGINTKDSSIPQLALKAGIVLDDPDIQLFTSTVFHEAAFGPQNMLLPVQEILDRVEFALGAVSLDSFKERIPSTLSGGEKQRLSIAAALAMKGKVLILDEPLCRLDPDGVLQVMTVLKDIKEKFGISIVMASHESAMMAEYADRVCILNNGRITAIDTAKNIFANNSLFEINGIQPVVKRSSHGGAEAQSYFSNESSFLSSSVCSVPPCLCDNKIASSIIDIKNFCYSYPGGASIENINLSIMENEFTAIIGNNGCGKTTLLKNITGLLRPCSGDIFIRGTNIKKFSISDISKDVGYVMQNSDTQLFTDSVYNEIAFALKNTRLAKTEIKKRVEDALNVVGLKDADAYPHILNRTDRTKTLLACILAMGCKIIILDEVDVGNDYKGNLKIMNTVSDLHRIGFTIIFVTHNMFLAEKYAHRIIKMKSTGIISDMYLNKGLNV